MDKFGLSYDEAKKLNPGIIYCSISGYGQGGISRDWPGYDLTVLAYSGLLSLNAEEGRPPIKFGVPIADITAGLFSDVAILAALHHRNATGKGQFIDMSMLDANFSVLTHQAMSFMSTGKNPRHLGSAHANISPYQVFPTADGYVAIAVGTEKLWTTFCKVIQREDLLEEPMFQNNVERVRNRDKLVEQINITLREYNTGEAFDLLLKAGIPAAPINTVESAVNSPQIAERGMVSNLDTPYGRIRLLGTPFKMSETPGSVRLHPPMLGENTVYILSELGYTAEEIAVFQEKKIVGKEIAPDLKKE
jgi:formyl-CoA transferase/CoA:oxalate CoA-transferase